MNEGKLLPIYSINFKSSEGFEAFFDFVAAVRDKLVEIIEGVEF